MRAIVLTALLAAFWLGLSGLFKPLLLVFGVLSVGLCVWLAVRMRTVDDEGLPIQILPGLVTYVPWLLWEIVKSNWTVAQIIIDPKLPISPTMTRVRAAQKHDVAVATFANSITLTPGTVSAEVEHHDIVVHALTREGALDVENGEMNRRVCRIEGGR